MVGVFYFFADILMLVRTDKKRRRGKEREYGVKENEITAESFKPVKIDELDAYLEQNPEMIYMDQESFRRYCTRYQVRLICSEIHEMQFEQVYEMMISEKNDSDRDAFICICICMRMDVAEMQKALRMKGFSALSEHYLRDLIIIVLVNNEIYSIAGINEVLTKYHMKALSISGGK